MNTLFPLLMFFYVKGQPVINSRGSREPWALFWMVAHFTMRNYGEHQAFRFVEGIWLPRNSRQIHFFQIRYFLLHVLNMF